MPQTAEPFQRISVEDADAKRLDGVPIIDTRELDEYQDGHVVDAPLMPYMSLMTRGEELETIAGAKDAPLMFICAKGQRSAVACEFAAALGFTDLYNIEGGTDAWRAPDCRSSSRAAIEPLDHSHPSRRNAPDRPAPDGRDRAVSVLRRLARLSGTQGYAIFVAIVVVVVLVYLFLSGALDSGGSDDAEQEIQQATPVEVQATAAPNIVAFEQSARVGNLDIAIESISWADEVRSQGRTQLATERFAILRLSAVNRGASPYQLQPDQIQIVAADGRSFVLDSLLSIGAAQFEPSPTLAPPTTLQPGLAVSLLVVFALPNDAGGLTLRIHGHYVDFALSDDD